MPADPSDIRTLALLEEPARRRLYDAVVAATRPLSRDDAAAAAGVSRALAAFHLGWFRGIVAEFVVAITAEEGHAFHLVVREELRPLVTYMYLCILMASNLFRENSEGVSHGPVGSRGNL